MAIESSNRSPSPMSIRQNPNPNPNFPSSRNHAEKRGDGSVRRSANGSPFPKAPVVAHPIPWCFNSKTASSNSPAPADHARRSSFTKESAVSGLLRDSNEHKENKKPNPNSIRGSKNFMSPTISAVSKVTTPSPRKRALAERNEAVRTSASLSDGKFLFFAGAEEDDLKGETENCEFQDEIIHKKEVTHVVSTCEAKKKVTFDDDVVLHSPEAFGGSTCEAKKKVTFDDDVVVLSPEAFGGSDPDEPSESLSFVTEMMKPAEFSENEQKDSCLNAGKGAATTVFVSSSPSPIAPLDADPSIPSYDPKTNFLSPRPQFLRYNPDRKAALYLENNQPKNLEDSLSSETLSDNDVESNAEEVQSEEVHGQEAESEFVGSSFSSSSSVVEEVKLDESPKDSTPQAHEEEMCVEEVEEMSDEEEEEEKEKPRFFTRRRAITWLALFGAVAFLSSMIASNAPSLQEHPIYEFARADFSGSLHSMREWSATYLPLMISSFRETEMVTPSQFLNFSALICDANDHFIEHRALRFPRGEVEESGVPLHPEAVSHLEIESPLEANLEEVEVQRSPQFEEAELPEPDVESQPVIVDVASEEPLMEDVASEEPAIEGVAFELSVSEDVASEQTYFIEQIESEIEVVLDVSEESNSYNTVVESGEADSLESFTIEGSAGNQHQGAVSFLVASLCVAIAVCALAMFAKYKKTGNNNKPVSTGQAEVLTRKEEASAYRNPSHASQLEAEDMDAETYNASAMSSYSIYDKTEATGTDSEAQSKEMKQSRRSHKRESLASSSSEYTKGSASYGSFTTYSILPTKNGDEEYVTPVRRSSRIRKQAP